MADFGPATGTAEQAFPAAGSVVGPFLEIHTQNQYSTPAASGIPGGIAGQTGPNNVGNNNLGPADFGNYSSPTAYGTVSNGNAVVPQVYQNFPIANPAGGSSAINCFRFKNPA